MEIIETFEERKKRRYETWKVEVKHAGDDHFTVEYDPHISPSDSLMQLEVLRCLAYPELQNGMRLDKTKVTIIRPKKIL